MFRSDLGQGLTIGQVMPHEARELFALVESERPRLEPWFDWTFATRDLAATHGFISGSLARFSQGAGTDATIRLDGTLLGNCGIFPADRDASTGNWEIGYWLRASAVGHGYATRVTAALIDRAFECLAGHRVILRIAPDNAPSRAVAERLGFTHEGTMRETYARASERQDLEIWGLLAREWPARRPEST